MYIEMGLVEYLEKTKSKDMPGGGSVVGYTGALGAALTMMVANLTYGKKSFESLDDKFKSFCWEVFRVDGHNFEQLNEALETETDKPKVIICDTIKGKGVSFMEDELKWHYFIVTDEILNNALNELDGDK